MARVVLVKGSDRYGNVARALDIIIDCIDPSDIEGKKVLIKPNLVSAFNPLAVTHVDAVRAVVDIIRRFSPESLVIAEATSDGSTAEAFRRFGYDRLDGVELIDVNHDKYDVLSIRTLNGRERKIRISKTVLESDYVISVARAKTHDHVFCTLTLKNMMGSVPHSDHVWLHGDEEEPTSPVDKAIRGNYVLINNLITVVEKVKIDLGVIDGFVGMEGDGPVDGTPKYLGVAAAGIDFVAVDAVMASVMGFDPWMKGDTYLAHERGLGVGDLDKIEVVGEDIEEVRRRFRPHSNYYTTQIGWISHHPNYGVKHALASEIRDNQV